MKKFLAILAIVFLFASCTTKKQEQTKTNSWTTVKQEQTNSWETIKEEKKEETKEEKKVDTNVLSEIIIIWDKTCKVCDEIWANPEKISAWMKSNPLFANVKIKIYDVSEEEAKKILKENELNWLPAILLNSNILVKGKPADPTLKETKTGLYSVPGAIYDFKNKKFLEEVWSLCENKKDDDWDGEVDCKENSCLQTNPKACEAEIKKLQEEYRKKQEEAMKKAKEEQAKKLAKIKSDRPKVDLYVMSYCPYGTQAEKPFLSIMKKFNDIADVDVKFVQYVMHQAQEWKENLLQYCIKTTQKEKFVPYLECFLKEGKSEECLKTAGVDKTKIDTCIKETDEKFKITEKLNDKTKRFPDFDIDKETALKAWVQGSPTLVINWLKIEGVDRTERGFAEAICKAFKKEPAVCKDLSKFSTKAYKPWFGFEAPTAESNAQAAAGCGK